MTSVRLTLALVLMVARILTGEASVIPEAAIPVAQVTFNRYPIWGWDGWHSIADEPADWAIDAAWEAWWGCELNEGNLYALSLDDMAALGFDIDAPQWRCITNGRWGVCLGKEWR